MFFNTNFNQSLINKIQDSNYITFLLIIHFLSILFLNFMINTNRILLKISEIIQY